LFQDDEIVRVEAVDEGFVAAVLRLIEDPGLRMAIGARAQARTQREFGWDKTLAAYEEVYAKVGAVNR
jgi:glycosyltransferase involved in cell wall biosynthesis